MLVPQLADLSADNGQGNGDVASHHRLLALPRAREMLLASSALERGARLVVLTIGLLAVAWPFAASAAGLVWSQFS